MPKKPCQTGLFGEFCRRTARARFSKAASLSSQFPEKRLSFASIKRYLRKVG